MMSVSSVVIAGPFVEEGAESRGSIVAYAGIVRRLLPVEVLEFPVVLFVRRTVCSRGTPARAGPQDEADLVARRLYEQARQRPGTGQSVRDVEYERDVEDAFRMLAARRPQWPRLADGLQVARGYHGPWGMIPPP